MFNAITTSKVDLSKKTIKITYSHPDNPNEELLLKIEDGIADLTIFKDFLSACFPEYNFEKADDIIVKGVSQQLYQHTVKKWLRQTARDELTKASKSQFTEHSDLM